MLHILIGYDAEPSGIQLIFYAAVVIALMLGMRLMGRASRRASARKASKAASPIELDATA